MSSEAEMPATFPADPPTFHPAAARRPRRDAPLPSPAAVALVLGASPACGVLAAVRAWQLASALSPAGSAVAALAAFMVVTAVAAVGLARADAAVAARLNRS